MKTNDFVALGRKLGDQILAARAEEPSEIEKAVSIAYGILAVMERAGVRVTVPMLEENEFLSASFKEHGISSTKLKPAVAEAKRRRKADLEKNTLRVPARPRTLEKISSRTSEVNVTTLSKRSDADGEASSETIQDDMFGSDGEDYR